MNAPFEGGASYALCELDEENRRLKSVRAQGNGSVTIQVKLMAGTVESHETISCHGDITFRSTAYSVSIP